MFIVKRVRFKNFRSYGNQFTEVDLIRNKTTVVTATNGAGKSSILMAIEFGLFGKVSNGIPKPDLVNTINKKDCLVEVECESLGRQITGFKDDVWNAHRFDIVCQANRARFSQHADLKAFLLQTGERILVEASPVDSIWGIGLAQDDPRIDNPLQWQGLNLLGFALMKVRDQLQAA